MVFTIASLLLILVAGIGYKFSEMVIHIRTHQDEDIYRFEANSGTLKRDHLEQLTKEEAVVDSPYGYPMRGWLYPAPTDEGKAIILVHGVTSSLIGSLKYMELFRRRGFHVLAYDHRRHGKSGGPSTTYGFYEKHDLNTWVDWLLEKYGPNCKIGIMGESMGASTALQHAAIDNRAAFYIADCPYSDLKAELVYRLKEDFRLPAFPLIQIADWFVWLRSGLRFRHVSPIRDIAKVHTPVLFIHGAEDRYTPKEMTEELYEAKPGFKQLFLMPKADHAQSLATDPAAYDLIVGGFLEKLGLSEEASQPATADHEQKDARWEESFA